MTISLFFSPVALCFPSFLVHCRAQDLVDATWKNTKLWTQKSLLSVAGMGKFSTDRTYVLLLPLIRRIQEYCDKIWHISSMHGEDEELKKTRSFPRLNSKPNFYQGF